jgi:hypothetical protein
VLIAHGQKCGPIAKFVNIGNGDNLNRLALASLGLTETFTSFEPEVLVRPAQISACFGRVERAPQRKSYQKAIKENS